MSEREQRLQELGYALSPAPKPAAKYRPIVVAADGTGYLSGALPIDQSGKLLYPGKLASTVSLEQGKLAAALCAVNLLRALKAELLTLDKVDQVLRVCGYVNSTEAFTDQHLVLNGASELIAEVFGDAGLHSRSAVGVAQLPMGASVEVDMIVRVRSQV